MIAIISLLVSILLPSLQKAKELARQVECAANLRSISLGIQLYGEDWDRAMVPRSNSTYSWWTGVLAPYMDIPLEELNPNGYSLFPQGNAGEVPRLLLSASGGKQAK